MNRDEDDIYAEALRWHAASGDDAMDWDGFTAWLEADARHREAYDAVALNEALLSEHRDVLAGPTAANDDEPVIHRRGWLRWAAGTIAASLLALLVVPQIIPPSSQDYVTEAGSRTIALADGSRVALAPHSRLTVSGRHQEALALNGGALFDIRHDPSRAMTVTAGGVEIGDIGTRFDVQTAAGQVRVAVSQGEVSVGSAALARPVRLVQGHGLLFDPARGTAFVQSIDKADVGAWQAGRLSFAEAPLALVAADLERYAGVKVSVAQSLRDRRFSGTLAIGNGEAALRDLSQLMAVELRRDAGGYLLDNAR